MSEQSHNPDAVARARSRTLTVEDASRLAGTLGMMAEPTRARILYALDQVEELSVGDLALALEVSGDSVGYALRLLRTAGLVSVRKNGRTALYRLADDFPEPLREHCLRQLVELSRSPEDEDFG